MPGFVINTVSLSGNLTRDPEVRALPSGASVCSLRLASNDRIKVNDQWQDRAQYFDVTVWKGMGEWIGRELHKGDGIVVHGRLQWREWQDRDGNKRQAVDIVADSIVPVPRDGRSSGSSSSRQTEGDVPIDNGDFERSMPTAGAAPGSDDSIPF